MEGGLQKTIRFPEWVIAKLDKIYENCYQLWLYTKDPDACEIVKIAQKMAERYQIMKDELKEKEEGNNEISQMEN